MKVAKVTRQEIITALEITSTDPGVLTLSKGVFTFRREFFYTMGRQSETVFAKTVEKLTAVGYEVSDVSYGEHWASFKGGEGVRKNSYWSMQAKINKKAA